MHGRQPHAARYRAATGEPRLRECPGGAGVGGGGGGAARTKPHLPPSTYPR
ncbi:MAG TPA: hypothetical protein VLU98_04490 [Methanomicrobiales archaeon]|nr:hypothetical protein [Methanomicrobiales archaeon]